MRAALLGLALVAATASPATAQRRSCVDLHARMMGAYQLGTPRYDELRQRYERQCSGDGHEYARPRGSDAHRMCEELRAACLQKERLGERGEGNCRRYREACRQ